MRVGEVVRVGEGCLGVAGLLASCGQADEGHGLRVPERGAADEAQGLQVQFGRLDVVAQVPFDVTSAEDGAGWLA